MTGAFGHVTELGRRLAMILLIVAVATDFAVPAVQAGFTSALGQRETFPHCKLCIVRLRR